MTQPAVQVLLPAGVELPAPYLAQTVTNANEIVARHGVTLRRASAQSVSASSLTQIQWDVEVEDTDDMWSSGTPTVITIPVSGLWAIAFRAAFAAATSARAFVEVNLDPAPVSGGFQACRSSLGEGENADSVTPTLLIPAGTELVCQVFHHATTTVTAELSVYRVTGGQL